MTRWVALLRGVNVGGRARIAMADLREVVESLGHAEVRTYLQSGNVVFSTDRDDEAGLAGEIENALARQLKLGAKVLVRGAGDLAAVVAANPFPTVAEAEPARLHVAFLAAAPDPDRLAAIDPARLAPDELRAGDRCLYLRYRDGAGRSRLTNDLLERRLRLTATARNWNTVRKLVDLTGLAHPWHRAASATTGSPSIRTP